MKETPGEEKAPIEMEKNDEGVYEMSEQATELIAGIDNFETMEPQEKVGALVSLMEELKTDNGNRFVVEELAQVARNIDIDKLIESEENQRPRIGRNISVKV